jgi:hypothetical protein
VGIIGVLEQLAPPDKKFYILDPIGGQDLPYSELDVNCYVVITTNEGSSHCWFDRLIPQLESSGVPRNQIVIRSACLWDPDSPVRHIHTIVDECSDFVSTLSSATINDFMPTHHYVCMNRGHRWQRYALVKNLLDRGLDQYGTLTYIELPHGHDSNFIKLTRDDPDWNEQRNMTDPGLTGALFNLVTETAFEPEHENKPLIHHHRPGMTEKSYKCFALWQIPVWLAPYRAVACYRDLGFDVFDDVVDHSYDLEPDPAKRIDMVADQVGKICQLDMQDLQQLKTKLTSRFQHNLQRLHHYANNFDTEIAQWKVLFLRNKPN